MKLLSMLIIMALIALLYFEWQVSPILAPVLPEPSNMGNQALDPDLNAPLAASSFRFPLRDKSAYAVIAQRTLFSAVRHPEEPEAAPPEAPPPVEEKSLNGLVLLSVIIRGDKQLALIKDPQEPSTLRLTTKDELRGWKINAITKEYVDLTSPNGTKSQLSLRIFKPSGPDADAKQPTSARNSNIPPAPTPPPNARRIPRRPPRS